jgi:hypothetical protein
MSSNNPPAIGGGICEKLLDELVEEFEQQAPSARKSVYAMSDQMVKLRKTLHRE